METHSSHLYLMTVFLLVKLYFLPFLSYILFSGNRKIFMLKPFLHYLRGKKN